MFSLNAPSTKLARAFQIADRELGVDLKRYWGAMPPEMRQQKQNAIDTLIRKQNLNPVEVAFLLSAAHVADLEIEEFDYLRKKMKELRSKGKVRSSIENQFTTMAEQNRATFGMSYAPVAGTDAG